MKSRDESRRGSALIVSLWVILVLSMLIGSFAFDMHVEAGITAHYRQRMKAYGLAKAGVEWSKSLVLKSYQVDEETEDEEDMDRLISAINLSRGVAAQQRTVELGDGRFNVSVIPEQGRYNINKISDIQWEEILDRAGIPLEDWDELIDCFFDYVDENDEHLINGAESDDSFYTERGYECKNAPLDTINELLLVKGFTEEIVFGGVHPETEEMMSGIASSFTTWGDGLINVNTASREVLETLTGGEEVVVEGILEKRRGFDGEPNTRDDGFETIDDFMQIAGVDPEIRDKITVTDHTFVRVISIGEVGDVRTGIWTVLKSDGSIVAPIFWREEVMQ